MKSLHLEKNGIAYIAVQGRMGEPMNPEFERSIREILKSDARRLLVDLSSLEYLRSSDLRLILDAVKAIHRKSGRVVICCLKGYVKEVFAVTCLDDMMAVSDSVESGRKKLLGELKAA